MRKHSFIQNLPHLHMEAFQIKPNELINKKECDMEDSIFRSENVVSHNFYVQDSKNV